MQDYEKQSYVSPASSENSNNSRDFQKPKAVPPIQPCPPPPVFHPDSAGHECRHNPVNIWLVAAVVTLSVLLLVSSCLAFYQIGETGKYKALYEESKKEWNNGVRHNDRFSSEFKDPGFFNKNHSDNGEYYDELPGNREFGLDEQQNEMPDESDGAQGSQEEVPVKNTGYPILGVKVQDISPDDIFFMNTPTAPMVVEVAEGFGADRAGIKAPCFITKLNGTTVETVEQLQSALANYQPGDTVTVTVLQKSDDGKYGYDEVTYNVELSENPETQE